MRERKLRKKATPRRSSARVNAREETDKERFDREEQGCNQEEQVSWLCGENDTFVRASGGGREDSALRDQDDPQLTASSASSSTPSPRPGDVESSEELRRIPQQILLFCANQSALTLILLILIIIIIILPVVERLIGVTIFSLVLKEVV
jgi:hypothetical protein